MKVSDRIPAVAGFVAAIMAILSFAAGTLNAQPGVRTASDGTNVILKNVTLISTTFGTNVGPVTVACSPSFCENLGGFLTPSVLHVICPQPAGATCTYYVHLETQAAATANDSGIFQFSVDGVAPKPGPTDIHGFFVWDTADPNSTVMQARSYAVVAHVTNAKDNQAHSIDVEFGCIDLTGDGCSSTMGPASMSIGLFTP
ncbi:MAG TPA: hypothetical protein VFA68_19745 [Terriglobales bacterium]|nr:hypothetical protein [Terriglobales bacterium]